MCQDCLCYCKVIASWNNGTWFALCYVIYIVLLQDKGVEICGELPFVGNHAVLFTYQVLALQT